MEVETSGNIRELLIEKVRSIPVEALAEVYNYLLRIGAKTFCKGKNYVFCGSLVGYGRSGFSGIARVK